MSDEKSKTVEEILQDVEEARKRFQAEDAKSAAEQALLEEEALRDIEAVQLAALRSELKVCMTRHAKDLFKQVVEAKENPFVMLAVSELVMKMTRTYLEGTPDFHATPEKVEEALQMGQEVWDQLGPTLEEGLSNLRKRMGN